MIMGMQIARIDLHEDPDDHQGWVGKDDYGWTRDTKAPVSRMLFIDDNSPLEIILHRLQMTTAGSQQLMAASMWLRLRVRLLGLE